MAATGFEQQGRVGGARHLGGKVVDMHTQPPSIVLTQEEAVQFLLRSAGEYEIVFCTIEGCDVCHAFCSAWNSVYQALSPAWRAVVDAKIDAGDLLAPRPVEEGF